MHLLTSSKGSHSDPGSLLFCGQLRFLHQIPHYLHVAVPNPDFTVVTCRHQLEKASL